MKRTCYLLLAGMLTMPALAVAQKGAAGYPEKNIRFVVPYPPSGGADVLARTIAPALSNTLGKQVVVENRPGAGGMIGSDIVAKAPNDGYTFLITTQGPLTINPSLYSKMAYDALRDFAPISMLASYSTVLTVHPSLPVHSVKELIALAKKQPGQIQYASGGNGTTQHLSGELLKSLADIDLVHVPYKGGGPAFTDLLAGHVPMGFASPGLVLPHSKNGRLRLLAVTSAKRSPTFPDLPSIAETVPGFEAVAWVGFYAPSGTPRNIIALMQRESVKIVQVPSVSEALGKRNFEVAGTSTEEFTEYYKHDFEKWAKVINKAGIKLD